VSETPEPAPQFPGLRVCDDVRPAAWLEVALWPWGQGGMRVGSLVPDGYPTYGRLLHAASSALGDEKVRWSDIAAHHDRPLGAQTRFNELVDWDPAPDRQSPPWPWEQPDRGSLTPGECEALAGTLARHTTTPDRCWFCMWEGYGWAGLPAPGHGPPRVKLEHRDCLLFAGRVRAAGAFRSGPWFQSPTLWWPDDRAWVVATDLDTFSTYLAVDTACLDDLRRHPVLEVLECTARQRVDPSPYSPGGEEV
jgi:hypothetical protein